MDLKKTGYLLVSSLVGILYTIFIIRYICSVGDIMWAGIDTMVIYPHVFLAALAAILNVVALLLKSEKLTIGCIGLYTFSAIVFPPLHVFVLAPIFLTLIYWVENSRYFNMKTQLQ